MTRTLALATALVFAGALAASAQTHPQGHPQGVPHPPHAPMDPALHAALHALLHGSSWHGLLSAPGGESSQVALTASTDKHGKDVFEMTGDKSHPLGAGTDLALENQKLQWQQQVSGKSCNAIADIVPATSNTPDTMKGTISCGQDQLTFALTKTK